MDFWRSRWKTVFPTVTAKSTKALRSLCLNRPIETILSNRARWSQSKHEQTVGFTDPTKTRLTRRKSHSMLCGPGAWLQTLCDPWWPPAHSSWKHCQPRESEMLTCSERNHILSDKFSYLVYSIVCESLNVTVDRLHCSNLSTRLFAFICVHLISWHSVQRIIKYNSECFLVHPSIQCLQCICKFARTLLVRLWLWSGITLTNVNKACHFNDTLSADVSS